MMVLVVLNLCGWTELVAYGHVRLCYSLRANRLIHRGTPNRSVDTKRPMLYLMYSTPWFREVKNFDDLNNEQLLEKRLDHPSSKNASKKRTKEKSARSTQYVVQDSGVVGATLFPASTAGAVSGKRNAAGMISSSSGGTRGQGKPTALAGLFG